MKWILARIECSFQDWTRAGVPNGVARFQRACSRVLGFSDSFQRHLDSSESLTNAQRAGEESRAFSLSVQAEEVSVPNRPAAHISGYW
jgi:hypothetical protein